MVAERISRTSGRPPPDSNDAAVAMLLLQPAEVEKCREATVVRREFVKSLLAKKQPPKGWQHFTVHAITHDPETASGYEGTVAAEMAGAKTGGEPGPGWPTTPEHGTTSPNAPKKAAATAKSADPSSATSPERSTASSTPFMPPRNRPDPRLPGQTLTRNRSTG